MAVYKSLTKYLADMKNDSFGEWIIDRKSRGTSDDPIEMPYVSFSAMVEDFVEDVYAFQSEHPEYELNYYREILQSNGIKGGKDSMLTADVSVLDGKCVMALILGAVRAERFCDGALLSFFQNGTIARWLLRLKDLDE